MRRLTLLLKNKIITMDHNKTQELGEPRKLVKNDKRPLKCIVQAEYQYARALTIKLPHGDVLTPVYMPVGTKGTMKGITSKQMEQLGCMILLSNTYHLAYKPGQNFLQAVGGLHKFMNWKRNILTDSGGFQMVSLSKLCEITEDGVTFHSPYDKSVMKIRPEDSIHIQNKIGSDIMMALDDVVQTTTVGPRMQQAMLRTLRWINRNLEANQNPQTQNLFPIVQGGIDFDLRRRCLEEMVKKDANGFAIGGLAGGEEKSDFFKIVRFCCEYLPKNKPRYLMGVGYPVDITLCSALGVDMFDCVFPTRTARFGTAFSSFGELRIRNKIYAKDFRPLQQGCQCQACKNYTRAYLHMIQKQDTFCHLLSMHNISFNFSLLKKVRKAIFEKKLPQFLQTFLNNLYKEEGKIPSWVGIALEEAKIKINLNFPFYQDVKKNKNKQNGKQEGKEDQMDEKMVQ